MELERTHYVDPVTTITGKRTIVEKARNEGNTWSEIKALAQNRVRWCPILPSE